MDEKAQHRILLILTGGTICSFDNGMGEQEADAERAQALIVKNFREGDSPYRAKHSVIFDARRPLDILSENMTLTHWNTLIRHMKDYDLSAYDGAILLHGTDTLAYTASLLSLLMANTPIPLILVSAQLPLYREESNGNANFKAAVELIVNGIRPNVYAVYRNEEYKNGEVKKKLFVHLGNHLLQCANYSNNFYSVDMHEIHHDNADWEGIPCSGGESLLYRDLTLSSSVLRVIPYVGLRYDRLSLKGVRAVLHGTYHSSTMVVSPYPDTHKHSRRAAKRDAILPFLRRCHRHAIPVFIEPCDPKAYAYETTGNALRHGAIPVRGMTSETAYVKLMLGCSMGLCGNALLRYMENSVNGEQIYP